MNPSSLIPPSVAALWYGRTPRERVMVGAMLVLVVGTAFWLLAVRPVSAWSQAAAVRRAHAEAVLADLTARLPAGPAVPAPAVADLEPIARQTARTHGLTPDLSMSETGALGFRLQAVSTTALFAWLADLEAAPGVRLEALSITETDTAALDAEGRFAPGG